MIISKGVNLKEGFSIRPLHHLVISSGFSLLLLNYFNCLSIAILNLFVGIFLDIDHFFEYFKYGYHRFKPRRESICLFLELNFDKIYLCLHSLEIVFLLWLLALFFFKNMILLGITIGYTQHLLLDLINNKTTSLFSYFLLYRIYNKFDIDRLFDRAKLREIAQKKEGIFL